MKQYFIIIALLGMFALPAQLQAENSGVADEKYPLPPVYYNEKKPYYPPEKKPVPSLRKELVPEKKELRDEMKESRQNTLLEIKEKQEERREVIKEKRDTFFEEAKEKRDEWKEGRKDSLEDHKERREVFQAQLQEKREALKAEILEVKKERVSVRKAFVEERFTQAIAMLGTAQERVGAKITEFEGKGYDMDEASLHLDESKDSLAKAKELLATLSSMTVSDGNETSATRPRETAKALEAALKETRDHLMEAVRTMKTAVLPPSATTNDTGASTEGTN